jgi:mono/diheme cytochrome c family protein
MTRVDPAATRLRRRDARIGRSPINLMLLAGAFVLCAAVAAAQAIPPASPSLSPGWTFNEQGGAALYAGVCAACHQSDARGAVGAGAYPPLGANKNLASADYLETALLHGLRSMPPVGRMMSDDQVADVINYVRTHFGNSYDDAITAADVKNAR